MNWDYLAGFIDGEGSIIISPPRIRLYISNTNREVLEKIRNFVNCGKVYEINMKNRNKKWNNQYCWTICSHKDVLKILINLRGKLVVKKEVCEKAIIYIENKRWQRDYLSKKELIRYKELKSSRKLAKELGVSQFSVLKYLKKYKLYLS
ncbi:MAG: LAGLIDADG family homing endonuclease [Nanoarchaeota archaeon]